MRKDAFFWKSVTIILVALLAFSLAAVQKAEYSEPQKETQDVIPAALPASLDALYPPQAEDPVFLFRMLGMATSFVGIVSDLSENDLQGAKSNFEKFKAQYADISTLVPEWEKNYPIDLVEELRKALESEDPNTIMGAYEKVGQVCHECHHANMARVQHKYHWKDFRQIKVRDPLTNENVNFTQMMQYLDANFVGISIDTEQSQKENAQKQFQGFNARFQAVKTTCEECHGKGERHSYVDGDVQTLIDEMGKALEKPSIDQQAVGKLFMAIGSESCHKCHLVHIPAALSKR